MINNKFPRVHLAFDILYFFSLILKKPYKYYNFYFINEKIDPKTLVAQGHLVAD